MTQPIHPMLAKVVQATSGWALRIDGDGYRVQYGCVVHGKFHATRESAMQELEVARARAAIQALLEPDENDPAYFAGEYSRRNIEAYLKPLLGDEG